jgi:hypothetical protein
VAHLIFSSTALAFLTNMCEKCKSASPSAIQVKNWQKTIGIEKKLSILMRREKCEQIVDTCRNVTLTHGIVHKICDIADRIKESAQSGTEVLCSMTTTVLSVPKTVDVNLLHLYCITNK